MVNSSFVVKVLPQVWQVNFFVAGLLKGGAGGMGGSGGGMGGGAPVWPAEGSRGFLE
jgi:hypothetical protein